MAKTTSPIDSTIFTHTEAANIVDLFEDLLDKFGIDIPDPDRKESENPARIYGMTYFNLVSDVEQAIIKILEKNSQNPQIVTDIFGEGGKTMTEPSITGPESGKSINTSCYYQNYGQYCFNRLPCGICTRTNSYCPLGGNQPIITWTTATSTGGNDIGK